MFVDRNAELNALFEHHTITSKKSQFLVVYGRRRLGKTTLIKEFLKKVPGVYIFIEPKSEELILKDCEEVFTNKLGYRPRFESWEIIFELAQKEKLTLVFDEFPNLSVVNPHLFSKIQKIWDDIAFKPGLFFIAIGSYVGLMKKIFKDAKQPLFGRASGMMRLNPFNVFTTVQFLSKMGLTFEQCLEGFAIFGGVPRYLEELRSKGNNIERLFFGTTSILKEEGHNILILEFGSAHKGYFSVLESMSRGKTTPKEIADFAGMNIATVSKYLGELLEEYEMVIAKRPITTTKKRHVRYYIKDNFFDFWFKNIYSKASLIEIDPKEVLKDTLDKLPIHLSFKMEDVIKEVIIKKKQFFLPTAIGKWWDRRGEEIDIVGVEPKSSKILFTEVKWSNKQLSWKVVEELRRKSQLVQWRVNKRKEHFLIVSRSGYTSDCLAKMNAEDIFHWDLNDLKDMILGQEPDSELLETG